MEKKTIFHSYMQAKRKDSIFKSKDKINLFKSACINSPIKNKTNYIFSKSYKNNKNNVNILRTDFSIIPHSNLKIKLKKSQINKNRTISATKKRSNLIDNPEWKKSLRGKLRYFVKNNIVLCEKKFHPRSFTESISRYKVDEFKNRFRNLDDRNKVGIFTNKFPSILNNANKFYTRYFDSFISPDELLSKNFKKDEIYQIKSDPEFFNFGGNFQNVSFFKKTSLKDTLNEEEKFGHHNLLDYRLKKSLNQTRKKIGKYLNYYSSVMSRQGLIHV